MKEDDVKKLQKLQKLQKSDILINIRTIIIYSLCIAFSLGFNDLFIKIFSEFSYKNKIIAQIIYVVILLTIICSLTYFYNVHIDRL